MLKKALKVDLKGFSFFYITVQSHFLTSAGVLVELRGISCHKCAYHMLVESRLEEVPHLNCQAPGFAQESINRQTVQHNLSLLNVLNLPCPYALAILKSSPLILIRVFCIMFRSCEI